MRALDTDRLHEGCDIVGEQFHRIGAGGLVAFAGAARIDADAGKMLGVLADLECVAGIVGREIRDEHERFARALLLIVQSNAVSLDLRHVNLAVLKRIAFFKEA